MEIERRGKGDRGVPRMGGSGRDVPGDNSKPYLAPIGRAERQTPLGAPVSGPPVGRGRESGEVTVQRDRSYLPSARDEPAKERSSFEPAEVDRTGKEEEATEPVHRRDDISGDQPDAPPRPGAGGGDVPIDPPDRSGHPAADGTVGLPEPDESDEVTDRIQQTTSSVKRKTPENIITDPELAELLINGAEALGDEGLNKVIEATQKIQVLGEENLRCTKGVLAEVTAYTDAAQRAGVDPEKAQELLIHTLDSYTSGIRRPHDPNEGVILLTQAVDSFAERGEEITAENVVQLKDLFTAFKEHGVTNLSLYGFVTARRVGLSLEDSSAIVQEYMDRHAHRQIAYDMRHFTDALRTLSIADVDSALIRETFRHFNSLHPEVDKHTYDDFKDAITFGCSARGMTPTEFMQAINAQVRAGHGNIQEAIERIFEGQALTPADQEATIVVPREQREKFFIERTGALEHAALPYRNQRPANEGLKDLERLTKASSRRWEDVAEGNWIFDPGTQTWYSMGGETKNLGFGIVRHEAVYFDPSELSQNPVSVHIHPEAFMIHSDKFQGVFPSRADYSNAATMMERANHPMQMRSFIFHPLGITEFSYPQNSTHMREVGERVVERVIEFFESFGDERHVIAVAQRMGEYEFVRQTVEVINRTLPEGFKIRLYPHGVDLEEIIRNQTAE